MLKLPLASKLNSLHFYGSNPCSGYTDIILGAQSKQIACIVGHLFLVEPHVLYAICCMPYAIFTHIVRRRVIQCDLAALFKPGPQTNRDSQRQGAC